MIVDVRPSQECPSVGVLMLRTGHKQNRNQTQTDTFAGIAVVLVLACRQFLCMTKGLKAVVLALSSLRSLTGADIEWISCTKL